MPVSATEIRTESLFHLTAFHANLAFRTIELHRIVQEVGQHLFQPESMAHYHAVLASIFHNAHSAYMGAAAYGMER